MGVLNFKRVDLKVGKMYNLYGGNNGLPYVCIKKIDSGIALMMRTDGYVLEAHNTQICKGSNIVCWEYSLGGRITVNNDSEYINSRHDLPQTKTGDMFNLGICGMTTSGVCIFTRNSPYNYAIVLTCDGIIYELKDCYNTGKPPVSYRQVTFKGIEKKTTRVYARL